MKKLSWKALLVTVIAGFGVAPAFADSIYVGSDGDLSAQAVFALSGTTLTITLSNTATVDAGEPADILTALFFGSTGTLSPLAAVLPTGSDVANGATPADRVVGGEWAYRGDVSVGNLGNHGISSTGVGVFGSADRFPGSDLDAPAAPNGMNFGIVNAGYVDGTGNGGMSSEPYIRNSVAFTFTVDTAFTLASINNVSFQYGTSLTEPNVPGDPPKPPQEVVPEPASMLLLGLGLGGLALRRKFLSC